MATNRATRYPGRWGAVSADYPMGEPKNRTSDTAKDGSYFEKDWIADYEAYFGAVLDEAGETVDGTTDTAQNSQLHKAMQIARQVDPLNNGWNGYLDPEHQSNLPAPNGYPGNSGGGEASYDTDDEISDGIFSATDSNSVSSDSDGWIFTGAIYKQETLTAAQMALFDEDTLPVFVKDQDGNAYSLKNGDTGVTVSIVGTTATVTISSDIFTGSFTKLWRFFPTERVGRVVELSAPALHKILDKPITIADSGPYTDGQVITVPNIFQYQSLKFKCNVATINNVTGGAFFAASIDTNEIEVGDTLVLYHSSRSDGTGAYNAIGITITSNTQITVAAKTNVVSAPSIAKVTARY